MSKDFSNNKENKSAEETNISPYLVSNIQSTIQPKIVSSIQPRFLTSLDSDTESKEQIPEEVQAKMENSFGQDFSNVNIHADSDQAKNIGAQAYAQGNNIHFAPGQYNPGSKSGQELLGHELTHVVQQSQGKVQPGEVHGKGLNINNDPTLEKEADEMGKLASEGKEAKVNSSLSAGIIQRKIDPVAALTIATSVYNEIDGLGSSKDKIISFLQPYQSDSESMSLIKTAYKGKYGYSMDAHISSEFKGEELKSILAITKIADDSPNVIVGNTNPTVVNTSGKYTKATSFAELIRLVRIAEDKLISAGHADITDRIRIFRGIYYGTNWSMDYTKEKSETRNIGFDLYTASTNRPTNPISILGESLFKALLDTPELKDGTRSLDFGHLMIGLESRSSYTSREFNIPKQGGTGLEAVTWLGDLGGGAGMVSMKRITNPATKTKDVVFQASGHDYGALINLEGDMAAYVLAKDGNKGPSYPQMKEYGYISDSLADYLLKKQNKTAPEWNSRVVDFAQMIGAKVDKGVITNKSDLISQLSSQLEDFGGMYALVRMKNSSLASEKNYREASKHIVGVSKEVAAIFVDMLERSIKDPAKPLVAVLNPVPSEKGEEYGVLKRAADAISLGTSVEKTSKNIENKIKEWIK